MEFPKTESVFSSVSQAPDVPIYALMAAFRDDPSPVKLNLGIGVYRTEEGKPLLLRAVRRAEEMIHKKLYSGYSDKEYIPPTGLPKFTKMSADIIFGPDSIALKENRVATIQSVSGSGSLRIGAEFLARFFHQKTVYIPAPTYANHPIVFSTVGMDVKTYRYYDYATNGLDFQGLLEDLGGAPARATVLLHLCGHNPTGVDPTIGQWEEIRKLIRSKDLFPFFDCAYHGFVTGDLDVDARPLRMFVEDGGECIAAQSYSKTMGIYAERIGALHIVCKKAETARIVEDLLQDFVVGMYLAPPLHGASIVTTILSDRELYKEWIDELKSMAGRVIAVRKKLFDALCSRGPESLCPIHTASDAITGTPGDWNHVTKQVGMFCMSGLNKEQVALLKKEHHVYMPSDGRINIAGLSLKDVPYLADSICKTVKNTV